MKAKKMRSCGLVLIAVSALCVTTASAANQIPWQQDIPTAQQMAATQNRLVLVHFTADWCAPCQRLEKTVFNNSIFAHSVTQDFVPVKINVSNTPSIAKQFNVTSWPTDIVMTANGQELHRMVSPQNDQQYLNVLRQVVWRQRNNPSHAATATYVASAPAAPSSSITAPVANFIRGRLGLNKQPAATPTGQPGLTPGAPAANVAASYNAPGYPNNFANSPFADPQRNGLPTAVRPAYGSAPAAAAAPTYSHQMGVPTQQYGAPRQGMPPQTPSNHPASVPNRPYAPAQTTTPAQTYIPNQTQAPPLGMTQSAPAMAQAIPATATPYPGAVQQAAAIQTNSITGPNVSFAAPHTGHQRPDLSGATNPAYVENPAVTYHRNPAAATTPQQSLRNPTMVAPTPTGIAPSPATSAPTQQTVPNPGAPQAAAGHDRSMTIMNKFVSNANPAITTAQTPAPQPTPAQEPTPSPSPTVAMAPTPAAPPTPPQNEMPAQPPTTTQSEADVKIAMDGFCPIALLKHNEWVAGHKRWGAMHRGHVYLFTSAAAQQQFLADPDGHAPLLSGYDPVVFQQRGEYVTGDRDFGIKYEGQIILFESETTMNQFINSPNQFLPAVQQALAEAAIRR